MQRLAFAVGLAVLGACSFSASVQPDGGNDSTITVGFERPDSLADEKSSDHIIVVKLSEPSTTPVTVKYALDDSETATPGADFDIINAETLTFDPGVTSIDLEVRVKADTIDPEPNETIKLLLRDAVGAVVSSTAGNHVVTINAKALPRVSFGMATSSLEEGMDEPLDVVLDTASEFEITVPYTVTAQGATPGDDYVLADGMLTFAPTDMMKSINLHVLDDSLDEDDEKVTVTLGVATNAITDNTKDTRTHTILDAVDPPPTVEFSAPTSAFAESAGAVTVVVKLSAVSGRTVTVPYSLDASSNATAGGVDFTLTAGPLAIPAGQMTGSIAITIAQDTIDEPNEVLQLDMGTATNATNTGQQTHQLTINDDDLVCFGANASAVCFDSPPTGNVNISGQIDTDGASCLATQPSGWTVAQDPACFIAGANITVSGSTTVIGTRPLVLVATNTLSVSANLDAASHEGGTTGPGTPPATCAGTAPQNNGNGAGGGAGGSFLTIGGAGGSGDNGNANGGTPAAIVAAPAKLRTGCAGQKGGNATGSQGGAGGKQGGALYLVSGGNMTIANNIFINVSGAGASASNTQAGGGGGGSGGMLQIFCGGTLSTSNNTKLVANGGGGSGGGSNSSGGGVGGDPVPSTETSPAFGGSGGGGNGGPGFAVGSPAAPGSPGGNNDAGGGGGGGGGYILSNKNLGTADVSAGLVVP